MRLRRPTTVSTLALALVVVTAGAAAAHPGFRDGATAPAGSLTTLELNLVHGCGTEDSADGAPTTEISIEVPEAFSYIAPGEVDGYEASTEGDGPVPEVVTWTATDGGVPAPIVPMDVVVEGEPGDEVYVGVFQGCEDVSYRWVGTPDEPADDPAVRLTLGEPDPDAPLPPEPEAPEVDEPEATADDEGAAADDGVADDGVTDDDGVIEPTDEDAADGDETPAAVEELPTEPPADEDEGGLPWLPIVLAVVVVAAIAAIVLGSRRKPVQDPTAAQPGDPAGGDVPSSTDR